LKNEKYKNVKNNEKQKGKKTFFSAGVEVQIENIILFV